MKFIVLLLFFFTTGHGQGLIGDNSNPGLTTVEFEIAKKKYLAMTETPTYKEVNRGIAMMNRKLRGVNLIKLREFSATEDTLVLKDSIRAILATEISKTDFKSLDEAVEVIFKNIQLTNKLTTENLDLYKLLSRATRSQFKEIFEIEFEKTKERIYGGK